MGAIYKDHESKHCLEKLEAREMTLEQLAALYHMPFEKLNEWMLPLKTINSLLGKIPKEDVQQIFDFLGAPYVLKTKDKPVENKVVILPEVLELLIGATWNFGRAILWGGQKFSLEETSQAKSHIRRYYEDIDPDQFYQTGKRHFIEFLERILLFRKYSTGTFMPHPAIWLSPHFERGFNSTKSHFEKSKLIRETHPKYRVKIQKMASLYAEHILSPSSENFQKAAALFSYRDSNLLLLFCNPIHSENPNENH